MRHQYLPMQSEKEASISLYHVALPDVLPTPP